MTSSQRIILNTLATYGRSVFGICLTLFSSRWVLQALGASDFGLYAVVGSIVIFIAFINGVMSGSVARFYAYSIGYGKTVDEGAAYADLNKWFNTALSIHVILPLVLVAIGYPIGLFAIKHWLVIPPDRLSACVWAFRLSLVTVVVNMLSVPYVSMYTAYQYIVELSLFGLCSSVFTFIGAYFLLRARGDRLIIYAAYMMAINAGIPIVQIMRAHHKFKVCRVALKRCFAWGPIKELFSYVIWLVIGGCGLIGRSQGLAVLVNVCLNPVANAAYAISNQVSAQAATLSQALISAFQPAIVSVEGAGNRQKMLRYALVACRGGVLLAMLIAVPLILEVNTVLSLWLVKVPSCAPSLCVCMLLFMLTEKITIGHVMAISASGKVMAYQLTLALILIASLPVAWLLFFVRRSVIMVGIAFLISGVISMAARLVICHWQLTMPYRPWLREVVCPAISVFLAGSVIGSLPSCLLPPSFLRVVLTTAITTMIIVALGWRFLVEKDERTRILQSMKAHYETAIKKIM